MITDLCLSSMTHDAARIIVAFSVPMRIGRTGALAAGAAATHVEVAYPVTMGLFGSAAYLRYAVVPIPGFIIWALIKPARLDECGAGDFLHFRPDAWNMTTLLLRRGRFIERPLVPPALLGWRSVVLDRGALSLKKWVAIIHDVVLFQTIGRSK